MVQRLLLFPSSRYLREQWWHRLAVVIACSWAAYVTLTSLRLMVFKPFSDCVDVAIRADEASSLNCGSNAFDYAFHNIASESTFSVLVASTLLIAILYVSLIAPALVYRIFLFVAKGAAWRY